MKVLTPTGLEDALNILAATGAVLTPVAGATDVYVSWPRQSTTNLTLLDLSPLRDQLGGRRLTEDYLEFGALATYWDVLASRELSAEFPLLAQAATQVGGMQIQTRGTWAGNIGNASPAADGVLALMAYDATVVLQSRHSSTELALDEYYTGYKQTRRRPDQLITAIRVPRRRRTHEWFYKVGSRRALTISKVGLALTCDEQGWRIAANSVAPYVRRCPTLEQALAAGQKFNDPDELRTLLDRDISPIDDLRSTAHYRATVLSRLLYYWLLENYT